MRETRVRWHRRSRSGERPATTPRFSLAEPGRRSRNIGLGAVAVTVLLAFVAPAVAVDVGSPPVTSVDGSTTTVFGAVPTTTATTTTLIAAPSPIPAGDAITTTLVPPTLVPPTLIPAVPETITTTSTTALPAVGEPTTTVAASTSTTSTKLGAPTTTRPPATPDELRAAISAALSSSTSSARSVEVSIDGLGTVFSLDADQPRMPASTQKLYVAAAAMTRFGPDFRFVTEVRTANAPDGAGTVVGELVVRASGDPGFTSFDLKTLADGVVKSGIKSIAGGLALDDSAFDTKTRLDIWKPSFTPGEVGVLSGFLVDGNHRNDPDTLADPGLANLRRFRAALAAKGIVVGPGERRTQAGGGGGTVVATVQSASLRDLITHMLKKSDNTYAEMLTKQVGRQVGVGSTGNGVSAIASFFNSLGVTPPTAQVDGSGLSQLNRSTAHQQVQFLRKVLTTPAGAEVVRALSVGCVDGTLRNRFCGTLAASNVQAKSGLIDYVSALTGVTRTASGKRVVFSFLLNGTTSSSRARAAIDKALVAVASSTV